MVPPSQWTPLTIMEMSYYYMSKKFCSFLCSGSLANKDKTSWDMQCGPVASGEAPGFGQNRIKGSVPRTKGDFKKSIR